VILITGAIVFALPFFWMVRTSIMPGWQVNIIPPEWIPAEIRLEHYIRPWTAMPYGLFFRNSLLIAGLNVVGTLVASSMVGYSFARLRYRGRDLFFMIMLSTMMLPPQVTLISRYVIFAKLGWVNTFRPLIIPIWLGGSAFNIFLFRQFFMTIPREMDDAALIDGCSRWDIFWRIVMPMSGPAIGIVSIMEFTWQWNNFMQPFLYLNTQDKWTIPVALTQVSNRYNMRRQEQMAIGIVALIPLLALFFFAQEYFVQGIVITGVKG
jgi:ABC-type glycerol-3-phosphate transport system permease component